MDENHLLALPPANFFFSRKEAKALALRRCFSYQFLPTHRNHPLKFSSFPEKKQKR
jgi:hypothetical protein